MLDIKLTDEETAKLFLLAFQEVTDHIFGTDLLVVNFDLPLDELVESVGKVGIDADMFAKFVVLGADIVLKSMDDRKIVQDMKAPLQPLSALPPSRKICSQNCSVKLDKQQAAIDKIARLRKNHKKVPDSLKREAGY